MDTYDPASLAASSRALQSLSSDALKPASRPKPSARTEDLIADLGLRYPPANGRDQEERAGLIQLLANDLADIPPGLLDAAIREWVRTKAFMPKASEIRNLSATLRQAHEAAERSRRALPAPPRDEPRRSAQPFTREELQRYADGKPGSLAAQIFDMGVRSGYIEHLGEGRYREVGGTIVVTRSAPGGDPCPA